MIDCFGPYPVTMAIPHQAWRFEAVQLGRFLLQTFENYLPFICPRLEGKRRVEVRENGQIQEPVGLGGPSKLLALSLGFLFLYGAATASE